MDNFRDSYFNVTWDLTKKHLRGTFWGKQYDTGRGFAVTIVEGGQVTVPSTETVRLKWEKPDSTEGYVTAVVVDGKFIIENIDQMFTVHGSVRSDLEIWRGGKVISSITFYVSVEKAVAVDAIESSSDFTALQEALADVSDMQAQVDAVIANATVDSEVILARGAEPTLGARLDGTDAQLAEIEQEISKLPSAEEINHASQQVYNQSDIVLVIDNLIDWDASKWEKGSLSSSAGLPTVAENRIRTKDFIRIIPNAKYKLFTSTPFLGGGTAIVMQFAEDGTFISTSGWQTDGYEFFTAPTTSKIKIVLQDSTGTSAITIDHPKDIAKPILTRLY